MNRPAFSKTRFVVVLVDESRKCGLHASSHCVVWVTEENEEEFSSVYQTSSSAVRPIAITTE